ncbi:MAG: T9SS type A sorting domain-containing protein [Bacteroidota bacterium]
MFTINGNILSPQVALDFEQQETYEITIRSTDNTGRSFSKSFTINLENVTIATDQTLTTGFGSFELLFDFLFPPQSTVSSGNTNVVSVSLTSNNATERSSVIFTEVGEGTSEITINLSDGTSTNVERFSVDVVASTNNAPTDISLAGTSINENEVVGTRIGGLSTTDPDVQDTHRYTLSGADASSFSIIEELLGFNLVSNEVFDFETRSSYSLDITTDDGNGGTFMKTFMISILDVDENGGVLSVSPGTDVAIYPNPAHEELLFDLEPGSYEVLLTDLKGRTIQSTTLIPAISSKMEVQSLDQGIYILRIYKEGNLLHRQRVIKE